MSAAAVRGASGGNEYEQGVERAGRIVFALLVLACFVAFFVTQRLKHTPTAVQSFKLTPFFSPTPAGHIKAERISFKLARADGVTVTVIDSAGNTVATLVRDRPVPRYKQFSLRWSGREGTARAYTVTLSADGLSKIVTPITSGKLAPAGEYRVRVRLREQSREVLSPRSFTLVRP
jgi:hypothetical protein